MLVQWSQPNLKRHSRDQSKMPLYPSGNSRIPLKRGHGGRPVLGPPDLYPQDPNQKEDELNAVHVKQGFTQSHGSLVSEEYGSLVSKNDSSAPIVATKVFSCLKDIFNKKETTNTLGDAKHPTRRQPINTRDNFWLVTGRNKVNLKLKTGRQWKGKSNLLYF